MTGPLGGLGITSPVLAAPMAGGPGTPALVAAAARAGGLGFLAGGYLSACALSGQIAEVRVATDVFGVNLFVPNPLPVDPDAYRRYAAAIQAEGERYGLDLASSAPLEDDDAWHEKIALLTADPVPVVSFTFGLPDPSVCAALRRAGSVVVQTVTCADEARAAAVAPVDLLAVQGAEAGGHSGAWSPGRGPVQPPTVELVRQVRSAVALPVLAAGGLASAAAVVTVVEAGALAAMVGTVLLRSHESGTSAPYRAALAAGTGLGTVVTRAFTGRPARALPNRFTDRYDPLAPPGYPAVHHLTSPLRRAAAAAGDAGGINLWAGTGHCFARQEPAVETLGRLAARI